MAWGAGVVKLYLAHNWLKFSSNTGLLKVGKF